MACAYVLLPESATPLTVTTVRGGQGGVSSGIALLLMMYALKKFGSSLEFDVPLVIWKDLSGITVWGSLIDPPSDAFVALPTGCGKSGVDIDIPCISHRSAVSSSENGHSVK